MGKRKHPPTASAPASAAPPRKKTRRSKPSEQNPGSDSDDSIEIVPSSQRKTKGPVRRAVAADSEDEGVPQALATPRAKPKRVVVVASDSEDSDEQPRRKKRLRRGSSPVVDVEDGEDDEEEPGPSRGRLRRKQEVEDEDKYKLDSDEELDDLLLPELPSSSRPTKKDARSSALQKYALARKNRSSPPPVPADAEKELDFEPFPEVDSDEEEQEDLEGDENDDAEFASEFIVDEDDEYAADATAELDRMRYTHRDLEENFGIFVEYMVLLNADPNWRETASEDDKEYYATAVAALRKNIEPLADTMLHTTWKAPFIATLQLRPVLQDGVSCDRTGNCHACWTRGMYSCDVSGSYELSTRKGTYDQDTFQKKKEVGLEYGTRTSFENNAEARNLPYPPKFKLYIGARCFKRATAYHEVRHCLYNYSVRVKERIEGLCEENSDLEDNVKAQLEALKEENFIDMLWESFKFDRNQWSRFANRKDPDVWG